MASRKSADGSSPKGKRGRDYHRSSRSHSFSVSPLPRGMSHSPSPRSKRLQRVRETFSKSGSAKDLRSRDDEARDRDKSRDREREREREHQKDMNVSRYTDSDRIRSKDSNHDEEKVDARRNGLQREKYKDRSPPARHDRSRGDIDADPMQDRLRRDTYEELSPSRVHNRSYGKEAAAGRSGRSEESYRKQSPVRNRERSRGDRDTEAKRDGVGREKYRDQSPSGRRSYKFSSPKETHHRDSRSSPRSHDMHSRGHHGRERNESLPAATSEGYHSAGADRRRGDGSSREDSMAQMKATEAALEAKAKEKEKPSFDYSGKLAAETNKVRGVALLFTEPPEARKPTIRWRLYVFKEGEPLNDPLYIHRQSCYLFGRERRVADIPTDHPSCSKQHAVIQYRLIEKEEADGTTSNKVRPYIMDLGSTNGTFLNGERIEPQRYYELFEKDTIKFGNSSREYVLLHEHSAG